MRIESFTVENFRSITSAKRVPLSNYTVLVGPNNEGKSNILKALNLGMTTLQSLRPRKLSVNGKLTSVQPDHRMIFLNSGFQWSRDYPLNLQKSKTARKCTDITIDFRLDEDEIAEFYTAVESRLNGTLPVKISFSENKFEISVAKPGKGHVTLNRKTARIAEFVSERLRFDYVPAIRTAGQAEDVVRKLVSTELQQLELDQRYIDALQLIDELQAPLLQDLSFSITNTVSSFLPSVKNVRLSTSQAARKDLLRRTIQINVDDGVETEIAQKGDGVQSLVALAIMRHASEINGRKNKSIVAIEEPESHLHPKAIRDLRDVIVNLSHNSQVIVSSHSPLLVRWDGEASTIIVGGNQASVAKRISDVRACLGVMVSDNLSSVEFAVLVEGDSDHRILEYFVRRCGSEKLKNMFAEARFKFHAMRGAGKIAYNLNNFEHNILGYHVFCDNDQAAIQEINAAIQKKALKASEYTLCICPGMKESELEDAISVDVYRDAVIRGYGVDVKHHSFSGNEKWSTRMKRCFQAHGKIFSSAIETDLKILVVESFLKCDPEIGLVKQKAQPIYLLLETLEATAAKA